MKFIFLISVVLPFLLMSFLPDNSVKSEHLPLVSSGIKFSNITFEKAVKQAKSTGKLVFIDVYTTWCGPCKEMAATTFKDKEVGALFNKRFINIKVDAEHDASGPTIEKMYSVSAFPTLLFVNGDGKLIRKLVGKQSKEKLLAAVNALK